MGSTFSSIPNYERKVLTKDGKDFKIYYHDLVDHIVLLRKVIAQPEMLEDGLPLKAAIYNYCERMSTKSMYKKSQQERLPWQIDWIWHVHRLHPLDYANDCTKQLGRDGIVDKKINRLSLPDLEQEESTSFVPPAEQHSSPFVPSIDLVQAVIRQRDFLQKFQEHMLFASDLQTAEPLYYHNLVQNYISFVKMSDKKTSLLVPTFDIDLIWHTHMRYPRRYLQETVVLCGFVLNHDDAIEKDLLNTGYEQTAQRWTEAYKSKYGENVDWHHLREKQYEASCAMITALTAHNLLAEFASEMLSCSDLQPVASGGASHRGGGDGDRGRSDGHRRRSGGCGGGSCGGGGGGGGGCDDGGGD